MYYEDSGVGEPILLIPGLAIDVSQVQRLIGGLCAGRRVIAIDNRGVGRSEKPDSPYSIGMMADDAAGLLPALSISRTDVLGISLGGRIALELALRHPEMVRNLILVSTSARTNFPRGVIWPLSNLLQRIPAVRAVGTKYPQPYYAYVRQREASHGYDATSRLAQIEKPTLVVQGRSDRMVPLALAEELHSGIRGSKLVSIEGGHIESIVKPEKLVSLVSEFLHEQSG
jgi:pimeloyl-ACP methyl ester carboxylesterase